MRIAAVVLLLCAGCGRPASPSVEETALERLEEADEHFERKEWARAAAAYEDVVRRRELIRGAWLKLSTAYAEMGERSRAAGALDRWLRIDPTDEEARARREALVK